MKDSGRQGNMQVSRRSFLRTLGIVTMGLPALKYIPKLGPLLEKSWEELRREKLREHKLQLERLFIFGIREEP